MAINFDIEKAVKNLAADLHATLVESAESEIQNALKAIERKFRERVAVAATTMIQSDYSVCQDGHILRIEVKLNALAK